MNLSFLAFAEFSGMQGCLEDYAIMLLVVGTQREIASNELEKNDVESLGILPRDKPCRLLT